jgi:putative spermidine/putrescine transport system permease protein
VTRAAPLRQRARVAPRVALALVWLALPLVPLVLWAAADRWPFPALLPTDWGTTGWRQAADQGAPAALVRSALLGLAVAALATPAGAMAGRALALHRVPARRLVEGLLLAPVAVPPFAVVMGLTTLTLRAGIPGTVALVCVLTVSALPYTCSSCARPTPATTSASRRRPAPWAPARARCCCGCTCRWRRRPWRRRRSSPSSSAGATTW